MTQQNRLRVVLVGTRNPLNIGAAARAMSNFGFLRLRVVNPYEPSFREARSAIGAAQVLQQAEEYKSVAQAVADCTLVVGTTAMSQRQVQHEIFRVEAGASVIREHLRTGKVALLFGSEKSGLSNADLSYCHWLMRIPTGEDRGSMNLGQAVAVSLYELVRQDPALRHAAAKGRGARNQRQAAASAGEMERVTGVLLEALRASGYLKPGAAAATEQKIRRFVRRLELSAEDAEVCVGMLRQMLWKMTRQ